MLSIVTSGKKRRERVGRFGEKRRPRRQGTGDSYPHSSRMERSESEGSAETSYFYARSKLHPPMSTDGKDDSKGGRGAHIVKVLNSSSTMAKDNVYVGEKNIIMR